MDEAKAAGVETSLIPGVGDGELGAGSGGWLGLGSAETLDELLELIHSRRPQLPDKARTDLVRRAAVRSPVPGEGFLHFRVQCFVCPG
jgi:hypothetical protein